MDNNLVASPIAIYCGSCVLSVSAEDSVRHLAHVAVQWREWVLVEDLHNKSAPQVLTRLLAMYFIGPWRLWLSSKSHTSPSNSVHTLAFSLLGSRLPLLCLLGEPLLNILLRGPSQPPPPPFPVLCALPAVQIALPHAVFAMKFTHWQKYSLRPKDMSIFGLITGCNRFWFLQVLRVARHQNSKRIVLPPHTSGWEACWKVPCPGISPMHCQDFPTILWHGIPSLVGHGICFNQCSVFHHEYKILFWARFQFDWSSGVAGNVSSVSFRSSPSHTDTVRATASSLFKYGPYQTPSPKKNLMASITDTRTQLSLAPSKKLVSWNFFESRLYLKNKRKLTSYFRSMSHEAWLPNQKEAGGCYFYNVSLCKSYLNIWHVHLCVTCMLAAYGEGHS